jgi:cytochrome c oxidase accessory protein FixG
MNTTSPASPDEIEYGPLYADRTKVYPKSVKGPVRRVKWAVLIICLTLYYTVPWIRYDRGPGQPDQALLLDMAGRRFYLLGLEIWPQELYYLVGLLVVAAVGLFLVTSLVGRVWCGFTCPQTVWTDLFMWVERQVEGDRNARMKLDAAPWTAHKALLKVTKHGLWLIVAVLTGGAWIMYYVDAPTVTREMLTGMASVEVYGFTALFSATTYVLAGWAREQVCTFMCPWPRFQSAMFDERTLTVTYEAWRGEKRGKPSDPTAGDCVDCGQCIAVCPTGIDIRDGIQLECIGCGLCADACNTVMAKLDRKPWLIRWDSLASQAARAAGGKPVRMVRRLRTAIYATLLVIAGSAMTVALASREPIEISVLHDRSPVYIRLSDGSIRNGYIVKILNKTNQAHAFILTAEGPPGLVLTVQENLSYAMIVQPDEVGTFRAFLKLPEGVGESVEVTLTVTDANTGDSAEYRTTFVGPPSNNAGKP